MVLKSNSQLQGGKYIIEEVLGQGGFGITYLGIQTSLGRKVAIKEFFAKDSCNRDVNTSHVSVGSEGSRDLVNRLREKFVKEARKIAQLEHPNIVSVIDIFDENGTSYYVMKYLPCGSLATLIKEKYPAGMPEQKALKYIRQVASALEYIHQLNLNHLDVKPGNIMLSKDDNALLIDFGFAKQYDFQTGSQLTSSPVGVSEGYAPLEQYNRGGVSQFSPESDIYSLGATLFKLLTGNTPPSASDVSEDGVPVDELKKKGISSNTIGLITKVMEGRRKDRMNSARTFINSLPSPTEDTTDKEQTFLVEEARTKIDADEQAKEEADIQFNVIQPLEEKSSKNSSSSKWFMVLAACIGSVAIITVIAGVIIFSHYDSSPRCETCGLKTSECEFVGKHPSASEMFDKGYAFYIKGDFANAIYWFQKSADQGDTGAQMFLGQCYDLGHGVAEDHTQAVYWFQKSADQGDFLAQYNLGFHYENGIGVSKDRSKAIYWYEKSADQGFEIAKERLEVLETEKAQVDSSIY